MTLQELLNILKKLKPKGTSIRKNLGLIVEILFSKLFCYMLVLLFTDVRHGKRKKCYIFTVRPTRIVTFKISIFYKEDEQASERHKDGSISFYLRKKKPERIKITSGRYSSFIRARSVPRSPFHYFVIPFVTIAITCVGCLLLSPAILISWLLKHFL